MTYTKYKKPEMDIDLKWWCKSTKKFLQAIPCSFTYWQDCTKLKKNALFSLSKINNTTENFEVWISERKATYESKQEAQSTPVH